MRYVLQYGAQSYAIVQRTVCLQPFLKVPAHKALQFSTPTEFCDDSLHDREAVNDDPLLQGRPAASVAHTFKHEHSKVEAEPVMGRQDHCRHIQRQTGLALDWTDLP